MSIRMKRLTVAIPENLRTAFVSASKKDGRGLAEIIRGLIAGFIHERSIADFNGGSCAEPSIRKAR